MHKHPNNNARIEIEFLFDTDKYTLAEYLNDGWEITYQKIIALRRDRDDPRTYASYHAVLRRECEPAPPGWKAEKTNADIWVDALEEIDPGDDGNGGNPAPAPQPEPTTPPAEDTPEPVPTLHIMPCEDTVPRWQAIVPFNNDPRPPAPDPVSLPDEGTLPDDALRLMSLGILSEYNADGVPYRLKDGRIEYQKVSPHTGEDFWTVHPGASDRYMMMTAAASVGIFS